MNKMVSFKYFTLAAVLDPEAGILGTKSMGTIEDMFDAVELAKSLAVRLDAPVDVMGCCVNPDDNRTVRYFPDGTVERLWQKEAMA